MMVALVIAVLPNLPGFINAATNTAAPKLRQPPVLLLTGSRRRCIFVYVGVFAHDD